MVSVVITTYNSERYIEYQLKSILNQTMHVDEFIIVDDCSDDSTVMIIKGLMKGYNYFMIEHEENKGYLHSFEDGIKLASKKIIFLSDHDDYWEKQKIEKMVPYFNDISTVCVFSNGSLMDSNNNLIKGSLFESFKVKLSKNQLMDSGCLFTKLLKNDFITGATLCANSAFLKSLLPFPDKIVHDKWIAYNAVLMNGLIGAKDKLIRYRIHDEQNIGIKRSFIKYTDRFEYQINFLSTVLVRTKNKNKMTIRLMNKLTHYNRRKEVTENHKYFIAIRELVNLNYFKYSRGIFSLLKDVFYK